MPRPANVEQTVTLIASTSISEDGEITPGILPIPALRTSTPKKNDENTALEALLEEEFKEKKNSNANSRDPLTLETQVSPPSLEEIKGEETHVDVPQNSTLSRSPSQETVFDDPDDLDKTLTRLSRESSNKLSNVPSTSPPSYKTDDSEESLSLNSDVGGTTNKKTNRFLPRAKYSMQQKGFIIFT
ncbi:hypothetical protein OR222_08170, partial [Wolbachia endosymbiont of Drosophila pseudotakahashii]|nr:hypothetical protein [Wolbachia endosymbiont of Drosophila pseudotakahashii]